jgi:uncharacterized protein YcbK (DUF882 family)
MKLSEHFDSTEFECPDGCGFGAKEGDINSRLAPVLETIREAVGHGLKINSGCRCALHNAQVGGVANSPHLRGNAADVRIVGGYERFLAVKSALMSGALGIGVGSNYVHVDFDNVASRPAIWTYGSE